MSNLREAAQAALEALETCDAAHISDGGRQWYDSKAVEAAIAALRAALSQPVQEPFGYLWPTGRHPEFRFLQQKRDGIDGMPLYTAPPQRLPLTDGEIHDCFQQRHRDRVVERRMIARAIERAHGIGEEE